MKKIILCVSVLMICFNITFSFAKEPELSPKSIEGIVNKVVRPYFIALKSGDTNTLKELMTKDMVAEKRVLFEQNKKYTDFLRRLYRDAGFIIVSADKKGNDILVNTVIKYSDGRQNQTKLYLKNSCRNGKQTFYENWKISRKSSSK